MDWGTLYWTVGRTLSTGMPDLGPAFPCFLPTVSMKDCLLPLLFFPPLAAPELSIFPEKVLGFLLSPTFGCTLVFSLGLKDRTIHAL